MASKILRAGFITLQMPQRGQLCVVETEDLVTAGKRIRIAFIAKPVSERADAEFANKNGTKLPLESGTILLDSIGAEQAEYLEE